MDTLKRAPDSTGYSVTEGDTNVFIDLLGGDPRVRADLLGAVKRVPCQWTLKPYDFIYMMAFYRTSTGFGSLPFLIPLLGIDDMTPRNYTARIVPGTWKPIASIAGLTIVLTCDLWVTPTNDTTNDATIIASYVP
jgi:hypothetical protein